MVSGAFCGSEIEYDKHNRQSLLSFPQILPNPPRNFDFFFYFFLEEKKISKPPRKKIEENSSKIEEKKRYDQVLYRRYHGVTFRLPSVFYNSGSLKSDGRHL